MTDLINRIETLEKVARQLEPGRSERARISEPVLEYAGEFLDQLADGQAYKEPGDSSPIDLDHLFGEQSTGIDPILHWIRDHLDRPGLNPASGGHLAYIPGGGIYPSALGDYLAAVTNRYAGVAFAGPGAVRMERVLIRWMARLIGFPETCGGDLTSGGSIASLIGIVSAREAAGLRARDFHRAVVYLTRHVHHSIDKALRIAGLGEAVLRSIDVDEGYRMRPEALQDAVRADRKAGRIPWMVVGSAGTTDTGSIDPMDAVGEIAARESLWFHIDAAYGGFFALCADGRDLLAGIERGDSVVMDPHKGLFLPYGSGAVLVRDRDILRRAHTYQANYMQDARHADPEPSPADLSPELTRHFRGLRLWLPLKLFGLEPFRAALEEKRLLARYFHERIGAIDRFETGPPPQLSVATYRYLPRSGDAGSFNRRLIQEVLDDGRVFLSSTILNETFVLRLAVLCFRTHRDTIDLALKILSDRARKLDRAG
jgi:glutamate/tyrosine decarboxylase-like PLP-dependent enzyme